MKLFVVDDSEIVRDHLKLVVSEIPEINLIGCMAEQPDVIERISMLLPEIVILGFSLRSGAGCSLLKDIKNLDPGIKVMCLINNINIFSVNYCKKAGADCILDKSGQFSRVRPVLWSWIYTVRNGDENPVPLWDQEFNECV